MAKEFAKNFYKSKAWRACRKAYIDERIMIDGGLCEVCHEELGFIVHHKIILTQKNINNTDITLNHKYLRYECKSCHDREDKHAFVKIKPLKCSFDKNGQPVPPPLN